MPNWQAVQSPKDAKTQKATVQSGIHPRYMSMGSWHADAHKDGKSRKLYKCATPSAR